MAPGRIATRVVRVSTDDTGSDPPITPAVLRALTRPAVLDAAATAFETDVVDAVGYASTTSAYVIGFDAEAAMVAKLSTRLRVPVVGTCASALEALRALDVERVALIGAPWFDAEHNELGATYFRSQGFDVVSSASAELAQEPDRIEPAAVVAWVSSHVGDQAQAIFIGGNGFRAAAAIDHLEAAIGRPVLTSNQVLFWRLVAHLGNGLKINGYSQLFAH
jgi:maleate isomerase